MIHGLPLPVFHCIEFLDSGPLALQGLFQRTGSKSEVEELIQQFERRSFTEVTTKPKRIDGNHPMVKDAKAAARAWGSPPQALPG